MKFSTEYNWYLSYIDTDMLWLDDVLNWDDVFELSTSDYNLFGVFTSAFFLNSHYFLDWFVKLSFLDVLFLGDVDSTLTSTTLFSSLVWDYSLQFTTLCFSLPLTFYSDFQDFIVTTVFYAPELTFALRDAVLIYSVNSTAWTSPVSVFDLYQDLTGSSNAEFNDYLCSFLTFVIYTLLILSITRIVSLSTSNDAYATRALLYLYSISAEVRFQFEAALQAFFFVFLYTSMMLMTFDDDQEEILEFFNAMCYYFFLFTLVYYFYKYSIHYFSFLEASKENTKSISFFSQFLFDALNIIAVVLRFLVLMIRLNIYDTVDDVLDSFYIFMADFEEEEYFVDSLFSLFSVMAFDTDVNDDRSFLLEDESDFSTDLFTIYFIVWGKFAYFWLFILEEIARVSLALYVTYIAIFEINAVNRSYVEDNFIASKRSNNLHNLPTSQV